LKVDTDLVSGHARNVLRTESMHGDLLVVGRTGASHTFPWRAGGTARSLVKRSHCPLAVIPTDATSGRFTRLVVGIDAASSSFKAVRFASEVASTSDRSVLVVFCWQSSEKRDRERWIARLDAARSLQRSLGVAREHCDDVEGVLVEADLVGALIGTAGSEDVIVVPTEREGALTSLFMGSEAATIVERSLVPVIVVPDRP
jgi:nucleotide-binding universal stress UspA family protein